MAGMRPAVTVVVPFAGSPADARRLAAALHGLTLAPGDEVVVADNTPGGIAAAGVAAPGVQVVAASGEASSYHARNAGARAASTEWLLFVDADCTPQPGIADAYFAEPVDAGCGALVGSVVALQPGGALVSRYAAARGHLDQGRHLADPYRPFGATANLLVRRRAWEDVGGFLEGVRSGEDADFCWRLQDAGWTIAGRPGAVVSHRHRETTRELLRQAARYGAGNAWLARRHPGSRRRPKARTAALCAAAAGWRAVRGSREAAAFSALDVVWVVAEGVGHLRSNAVPPRGGAAGGAPTTAPRTPLVVFCDEYSPVSETFVVNEARMLARLGHPVRVEAGRRPLRPAAGALDGLAVSFLEDDALLARLGDLAWLACRHPRRCLEDLVLRRSRWNRQEPTWPLRSLAAPARRLARGGERHLHAHFAGSAALVALRLGRLLDRPYSVTAHAYDIYREPRNLHDKLRHAAFATSGCQYTVRHLRDLVGPGHADRVHEVVMGVDAGVLRRRRPYPGGRTVLAVGRLVPKKGFDDLVRAAALLPAHELRIIGEGPERPRLEALVEEHGLGDTVRLLGALPPPAVQDALEDADVLAMPCVIAPDGDRDSMPVVVKEAMAMEVPVVATDEVGLPEAVEPAWGRLVPPRDPPALAAALQEVLSLPAQERAAMGAAGRARVLQAFGLREQTQRLSSLIDAAARG